MEKEPNNGNLLLAQELCARATEFLNNTTDIQMVSRVQYEYSEYNVELRSCRDTGANNLISSFLGHSSRYIYITKPSSPHDMLFSLDLNSVQPGLEPSGILHNSWQLPTIAENAPEDLAILLGYIQDVSRQPQSNTADAYQMLKIIDNIFCTLIDQGASFTTEQWSEMLPNETKLNILSNTIDGSREHLWSFELEQPLLQVSVRQTNNEYETVLEKTNTGLLETYRQTADPIKRIALVVDDDKVVLDDMGDIIGVTNTYNDEQVLIEAERAIGLRQLDANYLNYIHRCLDLAEQQL